MQMTLWMRAGLAALAVSGAPAAHAQAPGGSSPGVAPAPPLATPGIPAVIPLDPNRCAPATLFRTVIRNVTPGLMAADRAAQPRTLYRLGDRFMRTEEDPDTQSGDQNIVIVAEPDLWVANTPSRRARHGRDPGPDLVVKAPILPQSFDLPGAFRELEFGCEPEWVARNAPRPLRLVNWGGAVAEFHQLASGEHVLVVLMDQRRNQPLVISYARQGKPVMVLRYQEYRAGMPDRPGLFEPPKGYQTTEAPAQPPPM